MIFEFIVVCVLGTGEWSQFRGPNSDGHVVGTTTPLEWSDTKNVVWKAEIPGLGWSSPVIVDGKIFLTTAVPQGEGLSLRAMALDAATSKVIWDREVRSVPKAPPIHAKNSHASPTPIVQDGSVFVHFGTFGMARLKASEGTVQWTCTDIDYPPVHGSGGSPLLHEGKLVVACDGSKDPFVVAIDAETGKVAWKTPRSVEARITQSFVTSAIATIDGKAQVLSPGPNHFASYDLATGEELWRVVAPGWSVVPQPALGHGMVFYNRDYDHPEMMAVKLGGKGDVTESNVVWRLKNGAPSTPSPLLIGDDLYYVSDKGVASCVNAKTGELQWTGRLGGNYSASPIYVNGRVLFLDENGKATWVKLGKDFVVLGENEVPGRTFATPAFSDGAMYLRTDTALYKIAQ